MSTNELLNQISLTLRQTFKIEEYIAKLSKRKLKKLYIL